MSRVVDDRRNRIDQRLSRVRFQGSGVGGVNNYLRARRKPVAYSTSSIASP